MSLAITKQGNEYETRAGLKTGLAIGGIQLVGRGLAKAYKQSKSADRSFSNMLKNLKKVKPDSFINSNSIVSKGFAKSLAKCTKTNSPAIKTGGILGCALGIAAFGLVGAIFDKFANKKAAKLADKAS